MQVLSSTSGRSRSSDARRRVDDREISRIVTDDRTGTQWVVDERDASGQPGARGDRYLCFDSSDTRRRVWKYPTDWRQLDDPNLLRLCERRP